MHPALIVLARHGIPLAISALPKVLNAYVVNKQIEKETLVAFIDQVHPNASVMLDGLTSLSKDSTHLTKEALVLIDKAIEVARQCIATSDDSMACERHMDRIIQLVGEARMAVEEQRRHQRFLYKAFAGVAVTAFGAVYLVATRKAPNAAILATARKILRIG
jgi:hypothetical protein